MIDSMLQEGTDKALDDQVARPRVLPPPAPAFSLFGLGLAAPRGVGGGVAKSIAFGAEVAGAFGQVAGATGTDSAGGMFSTQSPQERKQSEAARQQLIEKGIEFSNEGGDTFRQRAADILPDPKTTHTSEQVVAGLADFATRAVGYSFTLGPLAAPVFGADVGMEEADRLKKLGVDKATRTKAGAAAAVLNTGAMLFPLTGPTAAVRFGKGVLSGEGAMVGQALAEREIVRAAGYDKIAETFDPLDPVALALGVIPGAIGARFGKPVKTEAQMREAAKLTPAEQARSDAFERSPENLRMLEEAIAAEKRPEVKAELQAELAKQQRAAAEHGVAKAVEADPDLVRAARVGQVVEALEASSLRGDDVNLAARTEHLSAVEMAADQMGRGEAVEVARFVEPDLGAPQQAGTVRLYAAAGDALERPVKLSTDLAAIEALARREGTGVHYLDLPVDHPSLVRPTAPEAGLVPHATAEISPDVAAQLLQRVQTDRPKQAAAAVDQLRATRTPPEPKAPREPAAPKEQKPKAGKAGKQEPPAQRPSGPQEPRSGQGEGQSTGSIERAAAEAQALDPEMLVQLEGMDAPMPVGELLAKVAKDAKQETLLGELLEVAAACELRS